MPERFFSGASAPPPLPREDADELTHAAIRLLSQRAELVLNAVDEGVYCLDTEGRTIFVNEAGARMFGFSPREMLGRSQHELIHHHYGDGSEFPVEACPIYASVREGITQRVGGDVFWHKDGSQVPVDYTSIPLKQGRQVIGAVVTFRDVSAERRVVQQEELLSALEASEERLRLAMLAGRMGSWEWDIAANSVYWSPEEEELYGLAPGTFEGTAEAYMRRIHPGDRDAAWTAVQEALAARSPKHHVVHRIVLPGGETRWLESHGLFFYDDTGRPLRLVGVSTDVTQRMRSSEAASLARRQLEEAFEMSPSAISITEGPDHVVRWSNAMARRLVGKRDVIGRPVREAIPELEGQGFFEILDRVYATGEPYAADEVRVVWDREGDGTLVESWFNVVYQPMRDEGGRITGVMSHSVPVRHG